MLVSFIVTVNKGEIFYSAKFGKHLVGDGAISNQELVNQLRRLGVAFHDLNFALRRYFSFKTYITIYDNRQGRNPPFTEPSEGDYVVWSRGDKTIFGYVDCQGGLMEISPKEVPGWVVNLINRHSSVNYRQ